MLINKQNILDTLTNHEDRLFVSKVLDQAILCLKYHEARFTDFLDPYQQKLIERKLSKVPQLNNHFWGGYDESERKVISFFPEYMEANDIRFPISVLEIQCKNMDKLTHRDFLGSILGLGIKREKVGDILINDEQSYVFCISDIKDFIRFNLRKVSNKSVDISEKDLSEIKIPEKQYKAINATVASLRLDAVLSAAIGESRSKVLSYIHADKVSVNWEPSKSSAQMLQEGDVLSIKGKGRIILDHVGGTTRKGRISIAIKRLI